MLFHCKQCSKYVSLDIKKQHIQACGNPLKSYNHPFIIEEVLYGKLLTITTSKSSSQEVKETVLMKKCDFLLVPKEKTIFVNREEGEHCGFIYSPYVSLKMNNVEEYFYVMADRNVKHGCVIVYPEALQYFSDIPEFVEVRKILNVSYGEELILRSCKELMKATELIITNNENFLRKSIWKGKPILFKKNDKISENLLNTYEFIIENIPSRNKLVFSSVNLNESILTEDKPVNKSNTFDDINKAFEDLDKSFSDSFLCTQMQSLNLSKGQTPNNSLKNSKVHCIETPVSDRRKKSKKKGEVAENIITPIRSIPKGVLTSTPTLNKPGEMPVRSKNYKKLNMNLSTNEVLFYIDNYTKITILPNLKEEKTERMPPERKYVLTESFHSLCKLIEKKFSNCSSGSLKNAWRSILVAGMPGCGKESLVTETIKYFKLPSFYLEYDKIFDFKLDKHKPENIAELFKQAKISTPCFYVISAADSVLYKDSKNRSLINETIQILNTIENENLNVIVIMTATALNDVHPDIRKMSQEFIVKLPNAEEREEILKCYNIGNVTDKDISHISHCTQGFTPADLRSVVRETKEQCYTERREITIDNLKKGVAIVQSWAKERFQNKVTWNDIYGYENVKSKLKEMFTLYKNDKEKYPLKNLLLYGPPGCSKTLFAKAISYETKFSFFQIRASDLLSKYVGESELSLNRVFDEAKLAAPSIIFIDEVDNLCSSRSAENSGWLITELLSILNKSSSANILIISATNRPNDLDDALFSPNCFECVFHIDLPNKMDRRTFWKNQLSNLNNVEAFNIDLLVEKTEGYSGAEILHIFSEAILEEINIENIIQNKELQVDSINLSETNLLECLTKFKPLKYDLKYFEIFSKTRNK